MRLTALKSEREFFTSSCSDSIPRASDKNNGSILNPRISTIHSGNHDRTIIEKGGSPVDAAIAALFCSGVVHPDTMGIGGGVVFNIYDRSD